jgi:hypothetical protein
MTETAPESRPVIVPVSGELLLRHLLCLDGELTGATVDRSRGEPVLVLHVNYPGAPENADELLPVYSRCACKGQANCPGQVSLTELQWRHAGRDLPPGA